MGSEREQIVILKERLRFACEEFGRIAEMSVTDNAYQNEMLLQDAITTAQFVRDHLPTERTDNG